MKSAAGNSERRFFIFFIYFGDFFLSFAAVIRGCHSMLSLR